MSNYQVFGIDVSDVERILDENHHRVMWGQEYADQPEPDMEVCLTPRKERAKRKKRQEAMRTTSMACAMFTGMGATFAGLGIATMHLPTLIMGIIGAVVFLVAGYAFEVKADEGMEVGIYE